MQRSTLDYFFGVLFLVLLTAIPKSYGQTFSASDAGINSGNEVCIDVSVADFQDIIAMQFSINYDGSLLTFSGLSNLSVLDLNNSNFGDISDQNAVTFSWIDPTLTGVNLNDGEIIFSLCFLANSAENTTTTISFSGNPTAIEILDSDDQLLSPSFNDGSITISSINGPLEITSSSVTPELCEGNNGAISINIAGGTQPVIFEWQGPEGFSSNSESLSNLVSGLYQLSVSDAVGNVLETDFIVPDQDLEITNASVDPIGCDMSNGSINITTNGINPFFIWNNGMSSEDIVVNTPGTYSVTVTEGNCSVTESFEILMEDGLAAYAYDCTYFNPDLTEAELHVVLWCGGTAPHTFTWSNGTVETTEENHSSITITNPGEELYSVTITDDFGFELILDQMEINCAFAPQISAVVTDVNCIEGTLGNIDITVAGGSEQYEYQWSNGATTEDISDLTSGSYGVTVTDLETGESTSESFFVGGNLNLAYAYECQYPISATTTVVAWSGIAPVTYEWSNGFTETVNNPDQANLSSLTVPFSNDPIAFTVTVTDATGCSETIETVADCQPPVGDVILAISPEQSQVQPGETVCLDVVGGNFEDIIAMQFSIEWDESLLNFDEVINLNLPDLYETSFGNPFPNSLTVSWVDYSLQGQSLDETTPIFSVCFTAIAEGSATIGITDSPTDIEVINNLDEEVSVATSGGLINIGEQAAGDGLVYVTTAFATPGENVCLEIRAVDLLGLSGMQFSVNWDHEALEYQDAEIFNFWGEDISTFYGIQASEADQGLLRFYYISDNIQAGINIAEDTPLFEVCFDVLANEGTASVDITDSPIPIEFINLDALLMEVGVSGGEVIILDGMWPGDTDINGIVNQYDLLNVGIAFDSEGVARIESTDWNPFYVQDWEENTPASWINFKHMDTDGNGTINAQDTVAISLNWGLTNDNWDDDGFMPNLEISFTQEAPFFIESDTVNTDQTASFDIILGDETNHATDIYGLAFTITFNPEVTVPGSAHVLLDNSWLGAPGQNLLSLYKEDYEAGELHVGITRTDGSNITGHGNIGVMQITIKDVIFRGDLTEMQLGIENVRIINASEQDILVNPIETTTYIDATTNTFNPGIQHKINVYPSPATDKIFISAESIEVTDIELYNAQGSMIRKMNQALTELKVDNLSSGSYYLRILTDQGILIKHISKI